MSPVSPLVPLIIDFLEWAPVTSPFALSRAMVDQWVLLARGTRRASKRSFRDLTKKFDQRKVYKLFTRVILNRIDRTLDEGQPCEQAGFRRGFSTIDHIHTVIRLIEVSREYKTPLCLTFIDLKKAFDSVEAEAVMEALCKQGVSTQ
ncbi:hypothetical protein Q1695_012759 [Nippostrongylus brasiliensis]|nr:hypothetical protein Q1695_012759 [Nippostrongylus brasiliensis]